MKSLGEIFGFVEPKQETKAMHVDVQGTNQYLAQLVRDMVYNGFQINYNADSSSLVQDGYTNVDIYSIINYLITTAAQIPFKVQVKSGNVWEDDPDSEMHELLLRPNELSTYSLFIQEALGWMILDGNRYIYAPRLDLGRNRGKTEELWVMPSTNMQVIGGDIREPIKGFKYSKWDDMIPKADVLYQRYFNPVDAVDNISGSLSGFAPLRAAIMASKKSNSAAMAGVAAFENNGAMGVLSSAGSQYAGFTQDQADRLGHVWKDKHGGANNYGSIAAIPGAVKFERLNMSPADLRLGEAELQTKRQLGSVFKFPTQLLNDADGATFSNQELAQKSIYDNTILPEMRMLGEGIANWIGKAYYPNRMVRLIPDTSNIAVLQANKKEQVEYLEKADWMTQNEKRRAMDLEEDPDPMMNDYLIPSGKIFQSDLNMMSIINGQQGQL